MGAKDNVWSERTQRRGKGRRKRERETERERGRGEKAEGDITLLLYTVN